MKIMLDIDGVLADFNGKFRELAQTVLGRALPSGDPLWWDLSKSYNLNPGEEEKIWGLIHGSEDFWRGLEVHPTTTERTFLKLDILSCNHDVYFVTMRQGNRAKQQTENWLAWQGVELPTVIMSGKKAELARVLGIEVIVDDHPDTIKDFTDMMGVRTYMCMRHYNANIQWPGLRRIIGIDEMLKKEGL